MPESLLPNASTDQQGLGQGGRPGGRGCLPPRLPAGGPRRRAGRVHICGRPGDPGRLPGLPRAALVAPVAPTVNQGPGAGRVGGQRGESGWMRRRQRQAPPSWPPRREIKLQTLRSQTCVCVYVLGGGREGARGAETRKGQARVTTGCSRRPWSWRRGNPRGRGFPNCRMFSHHGL